ncbi:hypothetical protein, partial [Cytobacillus oceanisediminis]|uniref:hypothetical protein n=1 Tax=Cytobacillus oceanisediminis TaxID=665099 RepID=UPI001642A4DB
LEMRELIGEEEKIEDGEELRVKIEDLLGSGVRMETSVDIDRQREGVEGVWGDLGDGWVEGGGGVIKDEKGRMVALGGGK